MYPDNQQPETQQQPQQPLSSTAPESAPINYLDQISVKPEKKFKFKLKKPVLIGIFVIIALVISTIISVLPKKTGPTTQLAARLVATNNVAVESSANLRNTQLRSVNGNLKMYFTNTIRDIKPLLEKNNVDINKLSSSAKSEESTTKLEQRLEDARLNGVYDRTYAREMSYKLSTIITLYKQIHKKTNDNDLKKYIETAQNNIAPIQVQFAEFNASNS